MRRSDLPPGIPEWDSEEIPPDGVYLSFYADGQLQRVLAVRSGHYSRTLDLEHGIEEGTDSGRGPAWTTYRPNGTIETGSHWDDDSKPERAKVPFFTWATKAIREIVKDHPPLAVAVDYRKGWEKEEPEWVYGPPLAGVEPCLAVRGGPIGRYHPWFCAYLVEVEPSSLPAAVAEALEGKWVQQPEWLGEEAEGLLQDQVGRDLRVLLRVFQVAGQGCVLVAAYPEGDRPRTRETLQAMMREARVNPTAARAWKPYGARPGRTVVWQTRWGAR